MAMERNEVKTLVWKPTIAEAQRKEIAEAKADEMKNKMKAAVDMEKAVLSGGLFDVAPEDRERGTGSGRGKRRR